MNGSENVQIPVVVRALLFLIRGEGSDELVGDIVESHARRVRSGGGGPQRGVRTMWDSIRSVVSWWSPNSIRARRMRRGSDPKHPRWGGDWIRVLRTLVRRPRYALLVVVTLGLGIGFTTTVFSVVDTIVLRPLPYPDADRIVAIGNTFPGREWVGPNAHRQHLAGVSYLNFLELRERVTTVEDLAAAEHRSGLLTNDEGITEFVAMGAATEGFFETLGIVPTLGRTFSADEYANADFAVALISDEHWRTRFGADPDIIGQSLPSLSSPAPVVIGVLPADPKTPEAFSMDDIEVWYPLDGSHPRYLQRGSRSVSIVGRLAEGATVDRARDELQEIAGAIAEEYPDGNVYPDGSHFGYGVNSLHVHTVSDSRASLLSFLGGATLLLLIAVLNAAGLQALRGFDRRSEIEVRRALGADRRRLSRELLTESLFLSAGGGLLGIALAVGGVELFLRWAPLSLPRVADVSLDWRILGATALISILAGIVSGAAPAWRLRRSSGMVSMRPGGSRTSSRSDTRFRMGLVSLQLGLALILSVGASLLVNSFLNVHQTDPGFDPEGLALFTQSMKVPGTEDQPIGELWELLADEVRQVPGVRDVSVSSNIPFEGVNWGPSLLLPGDPPDLWRDGVGGYIVTPNYFDVLGISMISGRAFDRRDSRDAPLVAIVNQSFMEMHAPELDPDGLVMQMRAGGNVVPIQVVGVVENVIQQRVEDGYQPSVYVPHTQIDWLNANILVRTDGDAEAILPAVRAAAARFSPVVPVGRLQTMQDRVDLGRRDPRFRAVLFGSFALFALILSGIGLFGTLSHSVESRSRELGVRVAVGADRSDILGLVIRGGLVVTVTGLVLGGVGALLLTRTLASTLYDVEPIDPVSFGVASIVLAGVAAVAILRPARRAVGVDVIEALRGD